MSAPVQAVVFDMDGVLIDSEPIWRLAGREVFATVGLDLTDEMCARTMGQRVDEVVSYWFARCPWEGPAAETIAARIVARVLERIEADGRVIEGVYALLESVRRRRLPMAVASSSAPVPIETVIRKLGIGRYFAALCSAAGEAHGKPHPAVYLTAARRLGVPPAGCLVFEDSPAGLRAARAAGMRTVAVPDAERFDEPVFDEADLKLRALTEFRWAALVSRP